MDTQDELSGSSDIVTLSSGVKVKFKAVSPFLMMRVTNANPKPTPPAVFIEDLGRTEENPSDPNYISSVSQWESRITELVLDTYIVFGVDIVEVPDGVPQIEDDSWVEMLETVGITIDARSSRHARKINWIKYIAAPDNGDIEKLMLYIGRASGTVEKDVDSATELFRDTQ